MYSIKQIYTLRKSETLGRFIYLFLPNAATSVMPVYLYRKHFKKSPLNGKNSPPKGANSFIFEKTLIEKDVKTFI